MDTILSPEVLRKQICYRCHNYLSVGPVMLSVSGVICGRCTPSFKDELFPTLFNQIAIMFKFCCVNYYNGCDQHISFKTSEKHEKTCLFEKLRCPFCKFSGNGCQLIHHFDKIHEEYLAKDGMVLFKDVPNRENLIIVQERYIFCIGFNVMNNFTNIFNVLLTPVVLNDKYFRFRFFTSIDSGEFVTIPIKISSSYDNFSVNRSDDRLDKKSDTLFCQYETSFLFKHTILKNVFTCGNQYYCKVDLDCDNMILSKGLVKENTENCNEFLPYGGNIPVLDAEIIKNLDCFGLRSYIERNFKKVNFCTNCMKSITDVYLCPLYHASCRGCIQKQCKKCNKFSHWSNTTKLHKVVLLCEWGNCNVETNLFNYFKHIQYCKYRNFKCPDTNCSFLGPGLRKHWHLGQIFTKYEIPFTVSEIERENFWFLPGKCDIVKIRFKYNKISKYTDVTINEYDCIVFDVYKFSVCQMNSYGQICVLKKLSYKGKSFVASVDKDLIYVRLTFVE